MVELTQKQIDFINIHVSPGNEQMWIDQFKKHNQAMTLKNPSSEQKGNSP